MLWVQNGMDLFLEFGKDVMVLPQTKRVLEGQTCLQRILNGVRGSSKETLSIQDAEFLCSFHIDNKDHFTHQDKQQIKKHYFCMLLLMPKMYTMIVLSKKSIMKIIQLQLSKHIPRD